MPTEIGRYPTKIGTHPHKQKKFHNMAVGPSRCCRRVVAGYRQTFDQKRRRVEREEGDFEHRFPLPKNSYTATRQLGQHKPVDFTQAAMFDTTTTLHSTRHVQQQQPVNFTQAHSSTTSPAVKVHQLHIYNNRQQHSMRQRHTCVFRLISPKSVGLAFIVYFHFTLYRHDNPY